MLILNIGYQTVYNNVRPLIMFILTSGVQVQYIFYEKPITYCAHGCQKCSHKKILQSKKRHGSNAQVSILCMCSGSHWVLVDGSVHSLSLFPLASRSQTVPMVVSMIYVICSLFSFTLFIICFIFVIFSHLQLHSEQ